DTYTGQCLKKCWSDDPKAGTMLCKLERWKTYIIEAGNSQVLPNLLDVFKSKKTSDYHEEMNHNKFKT
ncbi:MAG: hypothetical protein ACTS7I_02515, partial [Candidatus Hodgkinia cicadicola]